MRRLLVTLSLLYACSASAELAIVVAKESPLQSLQKSDAANIFLAKTNRLADGSRIKPLELDDDNIKADFYKQVTGKTLPQINSYWTTLIFTGKGRPPRSLKESRRLIDLLKSDPQTITYLPIEQVDESLKVVLTFP